MPSINTSHPITVLVTGANGYIAAHTIRTLLSRSSQLHVIGTVRSASKGTYLSEKLFRKEAEEGRFRVVIVADIEQDGAFDEVFEHEKIEAAFHMASPVTYRFEETDGECILDNQSGRVDGTAKTLCNRHHNSSTERDDLHTCFSSQTRVRSTSLFLVTII